jgi:hypothetical protein
LYPPQSAWNGPSSAIGVTLGRRATSEDRRRLVPEGRNGHDHIRPSGVTRDDNAGDLREMAITQLRKKRDLQAHLLAFVLVNLLLNGIWLITNPGGFYWPMFPLLGWGIGVAFHAWDVYVPEKPPEDRIRREMERLSHR